MEPRISVITLGVADLDRSKAFYEALGFTDRSVDEGVCFLEANGTVLGLWDRAKLAEDSGVADDRGGQQLLLYLFERDDQRWGISGAVPAEDAGSDDDTITT